MFMTAKCPKCEMSPPLLRLVAMTTKSVITCESCGSTLRQNRRRLVEVVGLGFVVVLSPLTGLVPFEFNEPWIFVSGVMCILIGSRFFKLELANGAPENI